MSERRKWRPPIVTRQCRCGKRVTARFARYCDDCRCLVRRKKVKYEWTPERDALLREHYDGRIKGQAQQVAAIFGWPKSIICTRAALLSLTHPVDRVDWSSTEEAFLRDWAGRRSAKWISRKLRRSLTAVTSKMKRECLRQRIAEGYTLRELELCFGVDHHSIDRWINTGKLKARRKEQGVSHAYGVTDSAIIDFVRTYPTEFRLDKVDQVWFMDLVIGGGLLRERAS